MTRSRTRTPASCCAACTSPTTAIEAVRDCDAAVLVTEWPEIVGLDFDLVAREMRGDVLIDGRNALDPDEIAGRRPALRGHREALSRCRP